MCTKAKTLSAFSTLTQRGILGMTDIMPKVDLPPNVQIRRRSGHVEYYFIIHPRTRPQGWPATIKLGRLPETPVEDITRAAYRAYNDYVLLKTGMTSKIPEGSLWDCCEKYEKSGYFLDLSRATQKDYSDYLRLLRDWSKEKKNPHVKHIEPKHIVTWLNRFHDTPVKQKRAKTVLSIVMGQAMRDGFINANPCRDIKLRKRKTDKRKITIWTDADVDLLIRSADDMGWPSVGIAVLIAYETGQRQGDVLNMQKPRDYCDGRFIFKQSKTGASMNLRATKRLKARLMDLPDEHLMLVTHDTTGQKWRADTFTHKFRDIADAAGLKNHIFMHLRHSAVLNLESAGCTAGQIAHITGHSLGNVMNILETYRTRSTEVADAAILRLENYRKSKGRRTR